MYNSRIFDILCILESKLSMKSADLLSTCSFGPSRFPVKSRDGCSDYEDLPESELNCRRQETRWAPRHSKSKR